MRKFIGIFTITMFLMMPLVFIIPLPVIAQPQEALSDAVGGGTGGTFYLDPTILYTGGVTITGDTRIYGQGAMIDLQEESIEITDTYLYIERCTITNGTDSGNGALEFYDGASGFVYDNVIVGNNGDGIYIYDCDEDSITIKENSIIQNGKNGIEFWASTDITILENIIANNENGIVGDNENLYDEDPNSLHAIRIKGNKICANDFKGIDLGYMNGISIASNLIYGNDHGIRIFECPIVSITNNKILTNSEDAIYYTGDSDWPDLDLDGDDTDDVKVELSLTISNNKMMGNHEDGIQIENSKNIIITYNEIMSNGHEGIDIDGSYHVGDDTEGGTDDDVLFISENILIAYNSIIDNDRENIELGLDGRPVSDIKILFNKISGSSDEEGIDVDGFYFYIQPISQEVYVTIGKDLLIKGNVINGNNEDGITVELFDDPVIIEWNTIWGNGNEGIELANVTSPQIIYNTIMYQYDEVHKDREGIDLCGSDGAWIAYNTVAFNLDDNIHVIDSDDVIIEYNTILGSGENGIEADYCEDMTVQHNKIYDNKEEGIEWGHCNGLIANNIIGYSGSLSGNRDGIDLYYCRTDRIGITTISDNTIIGNYHGIYLTYSDPDIIRNYIANNVYGIYFYGDSDPTIGGTYDNRNYIIRNYKDGINISQWDADPVINYNNIYENVGYGVYNPDGVTDDAKNNWWGSIDGPSGVGPGSGDEISSLLDYSPWLTANIP